MGTPNKKKEGHDILAPNVKRQKNGRLAVEGTDFLSTVSLSLISFFHYGLKQLDGAVSIDLFSHNLGSE